MPTRAHRAVPVLAVLALGLAACQTPSPTSPPAEPPTSSPPLVFGTAADYPPFEYYDDQHHLDGADIALAHAIGAQLGRPVEIRDMAMDNLASALDLDQIDAAVAALSVTPERAAVVDFTYVYYRGEDAVLGPAATDLAVRAMADLAGLRVGVARNTVHEQALAEQLVNPGLMPPENVVPFGTADEAVSALTDGAVDVVLMDYLPAQELAQSGTTKILAFGLNPQDFAMAVKKGNGDLTNALNGALTALHENGELTDIYARFLLPPSTVAPGPGDTDGPPGTAPTPADCLDGLALLEDLTLDDEDMSAPDSVAPGVPFVKAWKVRNTGTCAWDADYALVLSEGDAMGGQAQPVADGVPPDSEYTLRLQLLAPAEPGLYRGLWHMANGAGIAFGDRLDVAVRVAPGATPTPVPTPTPAPGISFLATPTEITQGDVVNFAWTVENARAQYFYRAGESWSNYPVGPSGTRAAWPSQTTRYNLRVVKPDGSTEVREITIQVNPIPEAPTIARFTLNPASQLILGACVDLSWQVNGAVGTVRMLRGSDLVADGLSAAGAVQDCPPVAGTITYRLEAAGPYGTARASRDLSVLASPPTATPVPAGATPSSAPRVERFAVSPSSVPAGGCFYVDWSVADANRVTIRRGSGVVLDYAPLSGSTYDCPIAVGNVSYRLEAVNGSGQSAFSDDVVAVTPR